MDIREARPAFDVATGILPGQIYCDCPAARVKNVAGKVCTNRRTCALCAVYFSATPSITLSYPAHCTIFETIVDTPAHCTFWY